MTTEILEGDSREVLATLPEQSLQCCVTSPPYWGLRDYGVDGQLGSEPTLDEYIAGQVEVFRAVRGVLRDDGTLWLNMGDGYFGKGGGGQGKNTERGTRTFTGKGLMDKAGLPRKNLIGQPWRLAFALQADGWYLRSDIIWFKPNPMPESVTDRPTRSHEYVFLLTKRRCYYYDADAVRERANACHHNLRTVWQIATQSCGKAHFAMFPEKLVVPCIKAGTKEGDTVLDPYAGSGTTGVVAKQLGRSFIGIELNPVYCEMARERIANPYPQRELPDGPGQELLFAGGNTKST